MLSYPSIGRRDNCSRDFSYTVKESFKVCHIAYCYSTMLSRRPSHIFFFFVTVKELPASGCVLLGWIRLLALKIAESEKVFQHMRVEAGAEI